MAFESGDVRGRKKTKADKEYAWKSRPMNMLDKSQNAMNDKAREGWDSAFVDKKKCVTCECYSEELDTCMVTHSRRLCQEPKA